MTTIKNKVRICPFIYIVCLLLFAACSNEDNAGKDIPSATFSIAPERGQIEGEIQFTNASYGGSGNFTYVWDFGDGTTSTEENPKHVYNEKGIFVVSLTITDSSGRSNPARGRLVSVALIRALRRRGVTSYGALRSPDFPPAA